MTATKHNHSVHSRNVSSRPFFSVTNTAQSAAVREVPGMEYADKPAAGSKRFQSPAAVTAAAAAVAAGAEAEAEAAGADAATAEKAANGQEWPSKKPALPTMCEEDMYGDWDAVD